MAVIINKTLFIIFMITISLNALEIDSNIALENFKTKYDEVLKIALDNAEFCSKKANSNPVDLALFKNIKLKT